MILRGITQNMNARNLEVDSRGDAETRRDLDEITGTIIDCSIKLHQALGPGLLESVYETILARDLARKGMGVERQKVLRFEYDGMVFEDGLRLDLLVDERVIVELKSVENLGPVHKKQLLTYLRLTQQPVGLLINFGAATLKEGLHRIVNNLSPSASPRLHVNQSPEFNAHE
jgi:GxxExxY protein